MAKRNLTLLCGAADKRVLRTHSQGKQQLVFGSEDSMALLVTHISSCLYILSGGECLCDRLVLSRGIRNFWHLYDRRLFCNLEKAPTQVMFPPSKGNRERKRWWDREGRREEKGHGRGYVPWCSHIKEMTPRSLRKTVLGHKADQVLSCFQRAFIPFKDRSKYLKLHIFWNKFSKIENRRSILYFQQGESGLFFSIWLVLTLHGLCMWLKLLTVGQPVSKPGFPNCEQSWRHRQKLQGC